MQIVDAATVKLTGTYDESTQDVDGTTLNDLAYSSVYFTIGAAPEVKAVQNPATSPAGGGHISTTVLVPAPAGAKTSVAFRTTETDTLGNESGSSNIVTFLVDRVLPKPPVNFTIG